MSKLTKLASTLSFAHLLGLPSNAAAAAEDEKDNKDNQAEDDKRREGESDEDYAKRMEEKDKDKAKGEGDDDKKGDDDSEKKGKGKAKGDDVDDDADAAKAAERARCAAIVAHGITHGCIRQAGVFAFDTDLSAEQAIAALDASALDGRKGSLGSRMSNVTIPNVGSGAGASAPDMSDPKAAASAAAQLIINAGKKRRGEA